jgi:putative peptide zinc metalloprotease protein
MTTTAEPRTETAQAATPSTLDRAEGVELLGDVHGSGYKEGAALVRRADGQMVQLGTLMYALLECVDGQKRPSELAATLSEKLGRNVDEDHVAALARKLAQQGLLAGTEQNAPPRRNPLLALRWKLLVTNPRITGALTAPFTFLFRPYVLWPVAASFVGVFWYVFVEKGVASATAQAFNRPGLLLLVLGLTLVSAAFHELGHATACRYGGAKAGGMGMGLYLIWPAFYTDVTDSYRLPRGDRLRVDLGGIYFNAVAAVLTMGAWLLWRVDALLLLVALQALQMAKNLSPMIRSDGYHILADATGIPDLYAHIGPTLRRLIPGRRPERSALKGRARLLVTAWVLIVVPVLLGMMVGAVLLLPRLMTSLWDSGHGSLSALPHEIAQGHVVNVLAELLHLIALALPLAGTLLIAQKLATSAVVKSKDWSAGRPVRQVLVVGAASLVATGAAWAWWPAGQYQAVRANENGTLGGFATLVSSPRAIARPAPVAPEPPHLAAGTHLALSMIPVGGATKDHPALFVISNGKGKPAVAILSTSTPDQSAASGSPPAPGQTDPTTTTTSTSTTGTVQQQPPSAPVAATAFPFILPAKPGPGDSQALAKGTTSGGVAYDVAYSLVTVTDGKDVRNTNAAYALASCNACTTVAVSFQVVLIVGQSKLIAPVNIAEALNNNCPACLTTAIADQIVVTLKAQPTQELLDKLNTALQKLNALSALGANGSPAAIAAQVAAVQQEIETALSDSGLLTNPPAPQTTTTTPSTTTTPAATTTSVDTSPAPATPPPGSSTTTTTSTPTTTAASATTPAPTTPTSTTTPTTTETTTTTPTTTTTGG